MLSFRPGGIEDLPVLEESLQRREGFRGYAGDHSLPTVRARIGRSYRELLEACDRPPLWIAQEAGQWRGFALWSFEMADLATEARYAGLVDFHAPEPLLDGLLQPGLETARRAGLEQIVVEVPAGDTAEEAYFSARGFHVELLRVGKAVQSHDLGAGRQKEFGLRRARERDRMFIQLLNAEHTHFMVPPGREQETESIRQACFASFARLDLEDDPVTAVLLAWDRKSYRSAGYIMVRTAQLDAISAGSLAYLYDLNVHRDYWGRYAAHCLVRGAENWLFERGVSYWYADISAGNPRPLKTAVKQLGFRLLSRRWARRSG
ncbi:MAG: GNAT family N-acetyltransferase [Armatimonadetes bacterium]|nr:GNAT family N-acetyltransferase [Armatimonadota bacterium]